MTGFGRASGEVFGNVVTAEIRSLNSKFLELGLRLSTAFREKEMDLRMWMVKELERGKVDVNIAVESPVEEQPLTFNHETIKAYIKEIRLIEKENQISQTDYLTLIMTLPNVMNTDKAVVDQSVWKKVEKIITSALEAFNNFREQEGKEIEKDFDSRLRNIEKHLKAIERVEPDRIKTIRSRIRQGLAELVESVNVDENRFEQEMIYFIEKLDISEEKIRLRSHCNYFIETIKSKDANGKKLGFIIQEIGREINTLGAKANHATMQQHVVEMKDELEKMKEQIANVL